MDSATHVALAATYSMPWGADERALEIFGAINHLLDEDSPIAPGGGSGGGSNYPINPCSSIPWARGSGRVCG